jgi:hypothetical protein
MPELGSYGSVRGAAGNSRPYRERLRDDPIRAHRGAGVRKAPMDEIARGGATTAQRALQEFDRGADPDAGGWNAARRGREGLQASDAVAGLKPAGSARNPGALAQILSEQGKVILGSLVIPMS